MTSTMTRVGVPDLEAVDESKHVKYTFGMVLGVDDFVTEFGYLSGRDRWLARDLLGYGTAWGLAVDATPDPADPLRRARVVVDRGVAVTPLGQLVCVPAAQCAFIDPWLVAQREALPPFAPPDGRLAAYVVLCYRDRPTDDVPIPGEPCRSDDELMAPSRLADDFSLELRLTPPPQVEEDAVREFVAWLREVPVVDGPATPLDAWRAAIRAAAAPGADASPLDGSPLGASPLGGSPLDASPLAAAPLFTPPDPSLGIPTADVAGYLREAFRLWTTELRPRFRLDVGCGSDGCAPPEDAACVLLAELAIPVRLDVDRLVLGDGDVLVIEDRRPYLLHERMLQEWALTAGPAGTGGPSASPVDGSPLERCCEDGKDGAPGRDGVDGAPGRDGVDGAPGRDGVDGAPGRDGVDGVPGRDGVDGAPGRDGVDGAPGRDGVDGAPGPNILVAGGWVGADGDTGNAPHFAWGDLEVKSNDLGWYLVRFRDLDVAAGRYVVKVTPVREAGVDAADPYPQVVTDPNLIREAWDRLGIGPDDGLFVRMVVPPRQNPRPFPFMIEISDARLVR